MYLILFHHNNSNYILDIHLNLYKIKNYFNLLLNY